jgi:FkbM family methyltransferase
MLLFDIGANIGRYSIANSNLNNIIAVEASPHTFKGLLENVKSFPNITCLNYAVCESKTETVEFFDARTCNTLSTLDLNWLTSPSSRFYGQVETVEKINVPAISLNKLIEQYGIPEILKIDVEGAEEIVINSLSLKTPMLCFEWASEWKDSLKRAVDRLSLIGFSKFHVQYEDVYTYRPEKFELDSSECKKILDDSKLKVDWGMIWCI